MARPKGSKCSPETREGIKAKRMAFPSEDHPLDEMSTNEKYIAFIAEITPPGKPNYDDIAEMERRFQHYLETCAKYDMKVGNQAAYLAIGIDARTVSQWENDYRTEKPHRKAFVQHVKQICAMYREVLMQDGKINPVTGIFWQKNFDGFQDQQVSVVRHENPLGELGDGSKIAQKYFENSAAFDELSPIVVDAEAREVAENNLETT